jgi:putative membrane-bound dehydrogenase-like protein
MPWKGGLLVAVAPDLIYFEGATENGPARRPRTLYTGFDLVNIQQLFSGLQWGLDNWVYGCAGGAGGTVRSLEKPDRPAVTLRGRGIRFHPDVPGSLEPMSGGGQFGLAPDDWQHWFVATNSQHLRNIILPDHYLRRNAALTVPAVTLDIPDHGAACKVYRRSPFEAWRVERTTRRAGSPDARRFPATELVPGGFITSGTSPVVYTADLFPEPYRGNTFVCDPANNLIHRDKLVPLGATFIAQRVEPDCEFFSSTDNWCRPVNLAIGPDGALYVADFYREVIETPLSLPDDIKQRLNLESRGRGRIWRIVPEGPRPSRKPALRRASIADLVAHLDDSNAWWRLTAQRLLMEREDLSAIPGLEKLASTARLPTGRAHALWTLHGLGALKDAVLLPAFRDPVPGVREQALRLAERRLATSEPVRKAAVLLADDPSPRVRFQASFTLGEADTPEVVAALARIAHREDNDTWTQTAILSSASRSAPGLLETLVRDPDFLRSASETRLAFLKRLAAVVGTRAGDADLGRVLTLLGNDSAAGSAWQVAVLAGLGQGLQNTKRPLSRLWTDPGASLQEAVAKLQPFFDRAASAVRDARQPLSDRLAAVQLLGYGPFLAAAPALQDLLGPQQAQDLQLAAVRALALQDNDKVAALLLAPWPGYSPALRREVLEALFARAGRLPGLLNAIENKQVLPGQLEPFRVEQLRKHPDAKVRDRAQALLTGAATPDRKKTIEAYRPALDLPADAARGKAVFKKTCSTCHRLENEGTEVGPDLNSALRTKTREGLLQDILDPSREVDPRYINYVVTTKAGRVLTGMIAAETASSVTLRRAEKAEDTVLRSQIDEIQGTAKSVMPEGLEAQLSKQDVADVIAYLMAVAATR